MSTLPIGEYALLSDCRSAALVSRDGSIDWLCFPRFDGKSVFARMLDEDAGHWWLKPTAPARTGRSYLPETMVLETSLETDTGAAQLVEAMAIGRNERGHDLGVGSPGVVIRVLTCTRGSCAFALEYAPRPEYGLIHPLLIPVDGGVTSKGGAEVLVLSASVPVQVSDSTVRATFELRAGESAAFSLQHSASWDPIPETWSQAEITQRLEQTIEGWRTWSQLHQHYQGPYRELVHLSGRVLQALMFRPTGAIVAAPTTSLPETIGGERNWDYRFTWIRDASLTLQALWVSACPDEAHWFFSWMSSAVASQVRRGADLQIMFGVGGERDLTERELPHLRGWRNSRPIRIGNGAWNQRQLDVYGELLSAARTLRSQLDGLGDTTKQFLVDVADAAAGRWRLQDQGIWEVRGGPRDFLYSKLMCWAALDCAIELAADLDAKTRVDHWSAARDDVRDAILVQGWSDSAGAFTQSFGSDELDASALMMPIVGFLPGEDPRVRSTIDAIAERLTDARGLVYRYKAEDGLAGDEGSFLLCTFWLAHAQALAGQLERAKSTFERAIAYTNDLGLLAEEVDPVTGELLGNFPQAFSHIGLVNAAWAISQAESQLQAN